ncbi:MAG TPA: hypothetical protein HA272_05355 [Methanoregula sp.]|nr:hypothetical protein [Methanoregula sp.]
MAVESFREAIRLLTRMPLLWVPGLLGGMIASAIWLLYHFTGAFFTSRLILLFGLVLLVAVVGTLVLLRDKGGDFRTMIRGGFQYYFRVLLPIMVIIFALVIIFILLMVTFGFAGITPDPAILSIATICVLIPTLMLTFFFDIAAVFEDRKVFESIQRSIVLVSDNIGAVLAFYVICALAGVTIIFALMMVWEIALFEKLEPITQFNETQMAAFTPEELMAMIGPDGIWITAAVLFLAGLLLIPFITTYKACFYRTLSRAQVPIRQESGEYDSKGRWYKY